MRQHTQILQLKRCNSYALPMDFYKSIYVTADCLETIIDNRLVLDDGQEGTEFYARSVDLSYIDVFISSRRIIDYRLFLLVENYMGCHYKVMEG